MVDRLKMHREPDSLISRASPEVYGEFRSFAQSGFTRITSEMWAFLCHSNWLSDPNLAKYVHSCGLTASMQSMPTVLTESPVEIFTKNGQRWFECRPVIGEFPKTTYLMHMILNHDDLHKHTKNFIRSIDTMLPGVLGSLRKDDALDAIDLLLNSDSKSAIIETRKAIREMRRENIKWAIEIDDLLSRYIMGDKRTIMDCLRRELETGKIGKIALDEWLSQGSNWANPIRNKTITWMEPDP